MSAHARRAFRSLLTTFRSFDSHKTRLTKSASSYRAVAKTERSQTKLGGVIVSDSDQTIAQLSDLYSSPRPALPKVLCNPTARSVSTYASACFISAGSLSNIQPQRGYLFFNGLQIAPCQLFVCRLPQEIGRMQGGHHRNHLFANPVFHPAPPIFHDSFT